jgi:glutathione S-transferase
LKLYQAEWCPFSHRVRAKLTELSIDYELVNVSASAKKRAELEEVAGTRDIPVLVDGERVITDSGEAISYLEQEYEADPEELKLHRRELSPTVYGMLPFGVDEATRRLRGALRDADIFPLWWEGAEHTQCSSPQSRGFSGSPPKPTPAQPRWRS